MGELRPWPKRLGEKNCSLVAMKELAFSLVVKLLCVCFVSHFSVAFTCWQTLPPPPTHTHTPLPLPPPPHTHTWDNYSDKKIAWYNPIDHPICRLLQHIKSSFHRDKYYRKKIGKKKREKNEDHNHIIFSVT